MGKRLIGFVGPITPELERDMMTRMKVEENEDDDDMTIVSVNSTKVNKITIEFKE